MRIEIKNFGGGLFSRPAGKVAFLSLKEGCLKNLPEDEIIEIDFLGVKGISPGWGDEVITNIANGYKNVKLLNTEGTAVQATLKTLREYSDLKI